MASRGPNTTLGHVVHLGALGVALLVTASCAHGAAVTTPGPAARPTWSATGTGYRVEWLSQLMSVDDIAAARGWWDKALDLVLGAGPRVALVSPMAVAASGDGWLAVSDPGLRGIALFDTLRGRATLVRSDTAGVIDTPMGIAFDGAESIVFVDAARGLVSRVGRDGTAQGSFGRGELQRPVGVAIDGLGRIVVVDTGAHEVVWFGRDGTRLLRAGKRGELAGELNYPLFAAVDATNTVWLVDGLNFRVVSYAANGAIGRQFGQAGDMAGDFARPKGITCDDQQRLFVVDGLLGSVQIYSTAGEFLFHFGGTGAGPGELSLPVGIAVDAAHKIYVADTGNSRVQIFQLLGQAPPP